MTTLLVIIWIILTVCLVLHMAVKIPRTHRSWFELKRIGDATEMRRERLLPGVTALRFYAGEVLVVIMTGIAVALWQVWGVVIMIGLILIGLLLARVRVVQKLALGIYYRLEPRLFRVLEQYKLIGRLIGSEKHVVADLKLESAEQLLHMVESSGHVLTSQQRTLIINSIDWHSTAVSTIMTSRKDITKVKEGELLGPLVLNDLHQSGYSLFPVIKGGIDTIVGILNISSLLEMNSGKVSQRVEDVMSPQVLRINQDDTLADALKILQDNHQHLLIVVDNEAKTVGLVTLSDITDALLGKS